LGDLILSDGADDNANSADYTFAIYGESFSNGQPEPIEVTIRTLLQDGARLMTQGYGNREPTFLVVVGGADSTALGRGEEALAAQMGCRNELGLTPPDGWAPESVFDVETSSFGHAPDDLLEVNSNERVYVLRFVCAPFVRPAEMDMVEAIPVTTAAPVVTVISPANSTTEWTARIGTLSDQGAFLRVATTRSPRAVWTGVTSFDLTGRHYVSLDVTPCGKIPLLRIGGVLARRISSVAGISGTSGRLRHTYYVPDASVASMEFGVDFPAFGSVFDFTNLTASNAPPYTGTTKQTTRSLTVAGSARTQGSLALSTATGSLGTVIVHTSTEAVTGTPALRPRRLSGGTITSDTNAVSGSTELLSSSPTYEIPIAEIVRGKHQLVVRLNAPSTTPITVTWSAKVNQGGTLLQEVAGSTVVTPPAAGYQVFAVANLDLPTLKVPSVSTASVRLVLGGTGVLDEGWLFHGPWTCFEAGSSSRAWIETPDLDDPSPAVYIGTAADQSDAYGAYSMMKAWGTHTFKGETTVFMVSSGSPDVASAFSYYRRYFNFVPSLDP
ncbi:hypothetical protein, partial [Aeromicrobium sp.]|uniref:hypothetical protein n=1 Tax=Aeromicrobium sp. TaxID=1871063 RepID=UPI0019CA9C2B